MAYVAGTRFAVYWVARMVPGQMTVEAFAKEYDLPAERVRAALSYAHAFTDEIESDRAHAEVNQKWIEQQDATARAENVADSNGKAKSKEKAAR